MVPPFFIISFGRLSKPTALPDFNLRIAFIISLDVIFKSSDPSKPENYRGIAAGA
jgi:hypothetical protein